MSYILIVSYVLIYYAGVFRFFMGGDDFFLTVFGPSNWQGIAEQFIKITQYRPISYSILGLYKYLPASVQLYHFISLALLGVVGILFYQYLTSKKIRKWIAYLMTIVLLSSHIIFYLVYAISGMVDLIFLLFFFLTINNYHNKPKLSLLMFFGAILSKEVAISIPIILAGEEIILNHKFSNKILPYLAITLVFYLIKFATYIPIDSAYTYQLSLPLLRANIINFGTWILNYRHGWQMGMPLPTPLSYLGAVIITTIIGMFAFLKAYQNSKSQMMIYIIWIFAGILPFIFLSRVLVFYLNVAWSGMIALIAVGLNSYIDKRSKGGIIVICIFVIMSLFSSLRVRKQWLQYSFVAVAEETASNYYQEVIIANDWSQIKTVCLVGMSGDSSWAIANGRAIDLFIKSPPKIISGNEIINLPSTCSGEKAVIYQNDSRSWKRVD